MLSETDDQRANCKLPIEHTDVTEKKPCDNLQVVNSISEQRLDFLTAEERLQVISVAARIEVSDKKIHKKIIEHKKQIKHWNKTHNVDPLAARKYDSYSKTNRDAPFFWLQIADETFPRVYRILNILFCCVEEPGGQVNIY